MFINLMKSGPLGDVMLVNMDYVRYIEADDDGTGSTLWMRDGGAITVDQSLDYIREALLTPAP